MHHGFYEPDARVSGSESDHRAAQIRMIEESLRFAAVPGFPELYTLSLISAQLTFWPFTPFRGLGK
ncbi:hypothetical protein LINGRAPRIM_LOCUS3174 [Linum grandiflorum]